MLKYIGIYFKHETFYFLQVNIDDPNSPQNRLLKAQKEKKEAEKERDEVSTLFLHFKLIVFSLPFKVVKNDLKTDNSIKS